jgi:HlyD family secretion protein
VDKPRKNRRKVALRLAVAAAGICAAGLLTYLFAFHDPRADVVVSGGEIVLGRVTRGAFREYVDAQAVVAPGAAAVVEAREAGAIVSLRARDGDMVRRGGVILELDNPLLRAELAEAEARFAADALGGEVARLEWEQAACVLDERILDLDSAVAAARKAASREKALYEAGGATRADQEDAEESLEHLLRKRELLERSADLARAAREGKARLAESTSRHLMRSLELARERVRTLAITTPADGRITGLTAAPGQSVRAGERIALVEAAVEPRLDARVDEWYLPKVAVGCGATVDYGGRTWTLRVARVLPTLEGGTFGIECAFTAGLPAGLQSGQGLTVRLGLSGDSRALLLPKGPFLQSTGGAWVFVVREDGRGAERRAITCGRQNPEYIEVLGGLEENDRVIVSEYGALMDRERFELR